MGMRRTILLVLAAGALATGCYAHGDVGYSGTYYATATSPDLVYVSPGVQVIADYDEPIFYSDNFYWRYDGGVWYRSGVYTGGWAVYTPPRAVLSIRSPYAYARYRPPGYVARNRPAYRDNSSRPVYGNQPAYGNQPTYRTQPTYGNQPVVRDHRQPAAPAAPARTAPAREKAPVVRDHRHD
jgi:hypothetical protein